MEQNKIYGGLGLVLPGSEVAPIIGVMTYLDNFLAIFYLNNKTSSELLSKINISLIQMNLSVFD